MKEHGFEDWWAVWPKNVPGGYQRKGGKQKCLQRWIKGLYWTQADTVIAHTKWMKTTTDWMKDNGAFIPMPITYLNQQRWDGAEFDTEIENKPVQNTQQLIARTMEGAKPPSDEIRKKLAELRGRH